MPKNLRTYMEEVRAAMPDEFVRVGKEVDSRFEATTVLRKLELEGRNPLTVFEKAKDLDGNVSAHPLVFNAFSSRKKICLALGMDVDDHKMGLPLELANRYGSRLPPIEIGKSEAPVKESVRDAAEYGFNRLPIPVHHERDGGPYILCGSVVTRDPDSGHHNLAMVRIHVKDARHAVLHAEPHHHTALILKKYGDMGRKAPVAVVIGHHPGFYLGSQWEGVFGTREYELCGSALGEPLRLVPSETWGNQLMVPADAEMVLECEVDWNAKGPEGPMGAFTRHYKNIVGGTIAYNMDPTLELRTITMRKDAYYQSLFIGHADHLLIGSIPKESVMFRHLKATFPGVRQVHMPPSGCGRHICYISIKQQGAGEAREAIISALGRDRYLKYVIAVDDDVDVFSDTEVLWALATRTQPDRATFTIPGAMGSSVDPTVDPKTKMSSKMGIDATKPFGVPFAEVCEVPPDLLESLRLSEYMP